MPEQNVGVVPIHRNIPIGHQDDTDDVQHEPHSVKAQKEEDMCQLDFERDQAEATASKARL